MAVPFLSLPVSSAKLSLTAWTPLHNVGLAAAKRLATFSSWRAKAPATAAFTKVRLRFSAPALKPPLRSGL